MPGPSSIIIAFLAQFKKDTTMKLLCLYTSESEYEGAKMQHTIRIMEAISLLRIITVGG